MTDQLRGLLEQAVPDDAPTLDPQVVAAAARRSRNRSRAALAGVAALAVVGGTAVIAALDGADDDGQVAEDGSSAPYDAPACPATLPELSDALTSVDSLDGLTSVRLCPDLAPPGLTVDPPSPAEQEAILAGMDALVEDLPGFADRVAATEPFDPARCATIDVLNTRQSLQLTYADGRQVLLPTPMCSPITVAGHEVDGQLLGGAFLGALDQQRSMLAYSYRGTVPLSCGHGTTPSPARPGRERIVAGVVCGHDGEERRLTEDEIAALDRASEEAGTSENTCDGASPPRPAASHLMLATDHGDVVRVEVQPCQVLLWHSTSPFQDPAYLRLDGPELTP